MKIGIYGGSFNPPHIGHLHVADVVFKEAGLDYIIFMPAGDPYMKPKEDIAPAIDRLHMSQLSVFNNTRYLVSNLEIIRQGPTYTYETMTLLKKTFPNDEFYLIVGKDTLEQMPSWNNVSAILGVCKIIVVKRGDGKITIPAGFKDTIAYIVDPGVSLDVSSTQIRNCIKNNIPINHLVDEKVINYIDERKLYK